MFLSRDQTNKQKLIPVAAFINVWCLMITKDDININNYEIHGTKALTTLNTCLNKQLLMFLKKGYIY